MSTTSRRTRIGALKAYLRATEFKDSDKYPFALYKLGWYYYSMGEYTGIDTMKMVVDISNAQGGEAKSSNSKRRLRTSYASSPTRTRWTKPSSTSPS